MTNNRSDTVELLEVARSCSCTAAEIGHRQLGPGESTTVDVTWRTGLKQGRSTDHLALPYRVAGAAEAPVLTMRVTAEVLPDILPTTSAVVFTRDRAGATRMDFRARQVGVRFTLVSGESSLACVRVRVVEAGQAVMVEYDGSPLDVGGPPAEVRVYAGGVSQSVLTVPVRFEAAGGG